MPAMKIAGYSISLLILLFGITIVIQIWRGKIEIKHLISESNGQASLSRFQFLVFTFVISGSYFMQVLVQLGKITTAAELTLPDVSQGSLMLLGISGTGYVVSKGIQTAKEGEAAVKGAVKTDKDEKPNYAIDY